MHFKFLLKLIIVLKTVGETNQEAEMASFFCDQM